MAHLANITINRLLIPSDQTDFVIGFSLADAPANVHAVLTADAGDLRLFKDDGVTGLPREIEFYDAANDDGYVWFKYTGILSIGSDTVVQLHADGVSTEPAFTDPLGRNEVWSDWAFALHLHSDFTDSTGNNTFTATGGTVTQNVGSVTFAGGWLRATGVSSLSLALGYVYEIDGTIDDINSQIAWCGTIEAGGNFGIYRSSNSTSGRWDHGAHLTTTRGVIGWDGLDTLKHYRWDTTGVIANVDGPGPTPQSYTEVPAPGTTLDLMGRDGNGLTGTIRGLRLYNGTVSDDWVTTRYNNESNPAFYTITEVSAGVGAISPNIISGEEFQEVHFSTVGDSHVRMVGDAQINLSTQIAAVLGTLTATLTWDGTKYSGPATDIATALSTEVGNDERLTFVYTA